MYNLLKIFFCLLFYTKGILPSTVSRFESHIELFKTSETFNVESTALLRENDKDVGFRVRAILNVQPVWKDSANEYLLKFNVSIILELLTQYFTTITVLAYNIRILTILGRQV